jgi:hypothetical protein
MRSVLAWITNVGTLIFGRSARKSVSHVSTQAHVAYADAPTAVMELLCQASLLTRVPR